MISKEKYTKALEIIEKYKQEQEQLSNEMELVTHAFPLGTRVSSKKNPKIQGKVVGFGSWGCYPQLVIEGPAGRARILAKNAIKIKN